MSRNLDPSDTAAEAARSLCTQLISDISVRIIDATSRRHRVFTGADIASQVSRAAENLVAKPVRPGDTVLFVVRPSLAAIASFLALIMVGARTVFLDLSATDELLAARTRLVGPTWILTEPSIALASRSPLRQFARRFGVAVPPLRHWDGAVITTRGLGSLRRAQHRFLPEPHDDALVVFTSGTTQAPRAVVHTQATLGATFNTLVDLFGNGAGKTVYADRFHGIIPAIASGATVVIAQPGISAETAATIMSAHQVTTWVTTPSTPMQTLPLLAGPPSIRHIILGSAPVTRRLVQDIRELSPATEVTAVYAMTEATPVAITNGQAIVDHGDDGDLVGAVVAGVGVELDTSGEIIISGSRVGRYLGTSTGPIRTGDRGHMTPDGKLVLDGRSKDMILVGARNIYPQQHEESFRALPGVADAALVGLPHRYADEELWLVVELEPGGPPLEDIVDAVSDSDHLAELPLSGLVCGRLPYRGPSNKLDRVELRQRVAAAVKLETAIRIDSFRDDSRRGRTAQ